MRIGRTLPPTAAPVGLKELFHGLMGMVLREKYLRRVEDELKTHFDVRHVFLVSSGKAALTLILSALKSLNPDKTEVVIPAYTCFSVPSAIAKAGLKVSLCDINPASFDFDDQLIETSLSNKTLCVVPGHLFGIPADMHQITTLCKTKRIAIVEDAAQAMGGHCQNKPLGTLGDVGFFSLGRGKNVTCGSGGIIVTNSDSIAQKIKEEYECLEYPTWVSTWVEFFKMLLLGLFIYPWLYWLPAGLPFLRLGETIYYHDFPIKKLSGMQAGLLNDWWLRLDQSNQARTSSARHYIKAWKLRLNLQKRVTNIPYLRLPVLAVNHASREKILSFSRQRGLGISAMYPTAIHEIEELREQFTNKSFSVAEDVSKRLLAIPTHELLTQSDKKRIIALCQELDESLGNREAASLVNESNSECGTTKTGVLG